ncbi:hypothetical protein ACQB60_02795 [Actinomycetota bacterium Odt1-20B]
MFEIRVICDEADREHIACVLAKAFDTGPERCFLGRPAGKVRLYVTADHLATDPEQHSRRAADAVRSFNHATLPTRGTPSLYPGGAYEALGSFSSLAQRLPQAFEQISTDLERLDKTGRLTACHGTPVMHVTDVQDALIDAAVYADRLGEALNSAHSSASPLGYSDFATAKPECATAAVASAPANDARAITPAAPVTEQPPF